ncbi:MAG: hypothetical protein CMQ73_00065 [Gammaproteobacteria bacterium]|nr:hypothetical protein [Gammaproteobacteria bacterium]OUT97212.1 MAG: hypothetical protein CBB96_00180 [Gammaproteobacteria bacterium TMED36]
MNNAVKKILILQSLLLIGCSSQNLVIDTFIPKPLVKMNESISVQLTFDDQIQNFIFSPEELQKKEASIEINFGNTQQKLFENVFLSFFKLSNESDNDPDKKIILIDVKLDKFEYLTPQTAANQKYSVWFKYIINIKDNNENSIDDWVVTGYGEQETGIFQGDEAFKRAIRIALRDTGANLSITTQEKIENITNTIS